MPKPTIYILSNYTLMREGFVELLEADFTIVGAGPICQAVIKEVQALKPSVTLINVGVFDNDIISNMKALGSMSRFRRSIVLCEIIPKFKLAKLLDMGVCGIVTVNNNAAEVKNAINSVANGAFYVSGNIAGGLDAAAWVNLSRGDSVELSIREIEIAKHVSAGMSSREIGIMLGISSKTVDVHRRNIRKKLHFKNTSELVNYVNNNALLLA